MAHFVTKVTTKNMQQYLHVLSKHLSVHDIYSVVLCVCEKEQMRKGNSNE